LEWEDRGKARRIVDEGDEVSVSTMRCGGKGPTHIRVHAAKYVFGSH